MWTGGVALLLVALIAAGWILLHFLDPLRLPASQWREYARRYITPEGRLKDTGNGNISHSEGQGYGMLLAEAYGRRGDFQRIWNWTRDHLQVREDNLFAWKWTPDHGGGGHVTDHNNASDGDLVIAWALLRASQRWHEPEYLRIATQILVDLKETCIGAGPSGPVLLPGQKGFDAGDGEILLNPSYYVFPALQELAGFVLPEDLHALHAHGLQLCLEARFGALQLAPDWVLETGDGFRLPEDERFPAVFGYNAVRVPLNLAWGGSGPDQLAPYARFWSGFRDEAAIPAVIELPGDQPGPNPALPGMRAIASLTIAVNAGRPFLPREVPAIVPEESYYSASLKMLTLLAARDIEKNRRNAAKSSNSN